jgi:riboflavin kinase/FMN adenylyltransferase
MPIRSSVHRFRDLPAGARPALALGNFDGMHLGHRAVLRAAEGLAAEGRAGAFGVLTFEPHPRSHFAPGAPLFRLTPPPMKRRLAARLGAAMLVELVFDADLARLSPEGFLNDVLIGAVGAGGLAMGEDFRFGRGRAGDAAWLDAAARAAGLRCAVVGPVDVGGARVASSAIREALAAGDLAAARRMLGRPFAVLGDVIHGRKLGRTIGYPTANMALEPGFGLRHGIYAVRVERGGRLHDGVASFGTRPTFDDGPPLLETFLFDFAGDLYGEEIEVSFVAFLRPELKFDHVEALVRQMDRDSAAARQALAEDAA